LAEERNKKETNAVKYGKADVLFQTDIHASVVTEDGKPSCLLAISDNGPGFEPACADKIFQMFTRLYSRNEYGGTGVELSFVKKVMENYNGLISVEARRQWIDVPCLSAGSIASVRQDEYSVVATVAFDVSNSLKSA